DSYAMGAQRARARVRTPAPLRGLLSASGGAWPFARGQRVARFLADLAHPPLEQYGRMMEWISLDEKRGILPDARVQELRDYDDRWYFRKYWREEVEPVTRLQYLDLKTYLVDDLLVKVDRASM